MGRPPLRLGRPKGRPQAPFQPSHENRYPFTNWSTFAPPKWSKFTPPLFAIPFLGVGDEHHAAKIDELKARAEEGDDAGAQHLLGGCYLHGDYGVQQDYELARHWLQRAADHEIPPESQQPTESLTGKSVREASDLAWSVCLASLSLAGMSLEGQGRDVDYAEAARWFDRAAQLGAGVANRYLGRLCEIGLGVPQDFVLAYAHYDQAREIAHVGTPPGSRDEERDWLALRMTPEQIAEAQSIAREWQRQTRERTGEGPLGDLGLRQSSNVAELPKTWDELKDRSSVTPTRACEKCGLEVSAHANFCGNCGDRLGTYGRQSSNVAELVWRGLRWYFSWALPSPKVFVVALVVTVLGYLLRCE